jgi:hypothetical protein
MRLRHRSLACRSNTSMSRTTTSRQPWPTARTPHDRHHASVLVVSTVVSISPSITSTASTTKPGNPSIVTAVELVSTT